MILLRVGSILFNGKASVAIITGTDQVSKLKDQDGIRHPGFSSHSRCCRVERKKGRQLLGLLCLRLTQAAIFRIILLLGAPNV